jgi:hypothetical protein
MLFNLLERIVMSNNYEGWKHIASAPKDKEIIVWDGYKRYVSNWNQYAEEWQADGQMVSPTHWRGCPQPPDFTLEDDE